MRTLAHWAARLYPEVWRRRYGPEFEALLEDMEPSWRDVWNVLGRALTMQCRTFLATGAPAWTEAFAIPARYSVHSGASVSAAVHAIVLTYLILASWAYVAPLPSYALRAPLPPPAPAPLPEMTDPRVFQDVPFVYTSLPLRLSGSNSPLFPRIVNGVGIYFPSLPDIGAINRRNPVRRVWPGQALEAKITRRVIPGYPPGVDIRGSVSVFVEYLIQTDGSVTVLRITGPGTFAKAATTALEAWHYRPVWFEHQIIEVVSRVEIRFDGRLTSAVE